MHAKRSGVTEACEMASATSAVVGFCNSLPCRLLSPPRRKGKEKSTSLSNKRSCISAAGRLSWSVGGNGGKNFALAHYSSNSDQQPEEAEGAVPSDEAFLPPDDVDYLWKLLWGSVGGGAVVKYGSIVFPDMTRPNIVQALLIVSLSVLVATVILIKESYSTSKKDLL
ncbi:uncharacterized protein LOC110021834 [Phalaenopsis equestris]|uniref:uncharacterized protein LOC110021834 n=1 Tax=Phalaenopsis equestris TaxID=78828 RepID=UPI0009E6477E|nr:uncharacterized protein LOC110021834 [Phalaenopsis equestris]